MKVKIENLGVEMQTRNTGVEFWLCDSSDNKLRGKLYVTKGRLIWCSGKTRRENGVPAPWNKFIKWMEEG